MNMTGVLDAVRGQAERRSPHEQHIAAPPVRRRAQRT